MEKDDWKNLGLANLDKHAANSGNASSPSISEMPKDKN